MKKRIIIFLIILTLFIRIDGENKVYGFADKITNIEESGEPKNYNGPDTTTRKVGTYNGKTKTIICVQFRKASPAGSKKTCKKKEWTNKTSASVGAIIEAIKASGVEDGTTKNYYYGELAINRFLHDKTGYKDNYNRVWASSERSNSEILSDNSTYKGWYKAGVDVYDNYSSKAVIKFSNNNLTFKKDGNDYVATKTATELVGTLSCSVNVGKCEVSDKKIKVTVPISQIDRTKGKTIKLTVTATKTYNMAMRYDCGTGYQDVTPLITEPKTYTKENILKGTISPYKLTVKKSDTSGNSLSGATINLYSGKGCNGKSIANNEGKKEHTFKLNPYVDYSYKETKAPNGYTIDSSCHNIIAGKSGGSTTKTITNKKNSTTTSGQFYFKIFASGIETDATGIDTNAFDKYFTKNTDGERPYAISGTKFKICSDSNCSKVIAASIDANTDSAILLDSCTTTYTCESGYSISGTKCKKGTTTKNTTCPTYYIKETARPTIYNLWYYKTKYWKKKDDGSNDWELDTGEKKDNDLKNQTSDVIKITATDKGKSLHLRVLHKYNKKDVCDTELTELSKLGNDSTERRYKLINLYNKYKYNKLLDFKDPKCEETNSTTEYNTSNSCSSSKITHTGNTIPIFSKNLSDKMVLTTDNISAYCYYTSIESKALEGSPFYSENNNPNPTINSGQMVWSSNENSNIYTSNVNLKCEAYYLKKDNSEISTITDNISSYLDDISYTGKHNLGSTTSDEIDFKLENELTTSNEFDPNTSCNGNYCYATWEANETINYKYGSDLTWYFQKNGMGTATNACTTEECIGPVYGFLTDITANGSFTTTITADISNLISEKKLEHVCSYTSSPQIVTPSDNNKLNLEFRVIDTSSWANAFPGIDGDGKNARKHIGDNWTGKTTEITEKIKKVITERNNSNNRKSKTPILSIKLNTTNINKIREYNSSNQYYVSDINCTNGKECKTSFVSELLNGDYGTVSGSCEKSENRKYCVGSD